MSIEERDNDDLIRITHYINPHNFWFKHESAYLYNADEQEFQLELIEFCENTFGRGNITSGVYKPTQIGELVAVFYFQLGRWTRAKIDEIQQDLSGEVMCNVWAIDEGVPIKTSCRYLKPLPARFGKMPSTVKHGGLKGILPAESSYNYLEGRSVHKMVEAWCSGVVRVFQSLIEDAVSIKFCDQRHYQAQGVDMYFGTLKLTSHQNVTNNAVDLLKKAGGKMVMMVDEDEFYDKFPLLRTLDMRRSEDNEHRENMKYHTNTFRPEYASTTGAFETERKRFQDKYLIEQAREKFVEWDKRNTASSTVQGSNVCLDDYFPFSSQQLTKPVVSPLVQSSVPQSKPRRRYELEYDTLVDESDSEKESEAFAASQQRRCPPKTNQHAKNLNNQIARPPARPHNGDIYEKSIADLAPALHKIKLRRRAAIQKEMDAGSSSKANGNHPTLNIMPAGFDLGNVQFANGNTILGSSEVGVGARSAVSSQKPPRCSVVTNRRPRPQQRNDYHDSSLEEEMIRKLDIGGGNVEPADDEEEEERW